MNGKTVLGITMTVLSVSTLFFTFFTCTASFQNSSLSEAHVYESARTTILILVNETIYPEIGESLEVFKEDLTSDGFRPIVVTLSNGLTPPEVKDVIKSYYAEENISGCILIGDVKAAYSEIRTGDYSNSSAWKIWISLDAVDMYYMDLNGYWENVTHPDFYAHMPPNVVEVNLYQSCETFYDEYIVYLDETKKWDYNAIENKTQYQAEIWVSRIMGRNLAVPGSNETAIIKSFMEWDHEFRTRQKPIEDLVYLLNTGPGYNDQNMDYSQIFGSIIKQEYVTKNDYLDCLGNPKGSKLIYLTAHSWPQGHAMNDTYLTVDELADSNKTSVFYILNACSACRWDQYVSSPSNPNYLGGTYVFDKDEDNHGLGTIGFTGVGGFNWLECFTDYLSSSPNGCYGEAYRYWFNQNLMHIFGATNYVYLGDPTIGPKTPKLPVHNLETGLSYKTIQEAINANETLDGHTILVDAGTYYENVVVNKSVALVGEDRSNTIVDGNFTGKVFTVTSNSVNITGFTVRNHGKEWWDSGIFVQGSKTCNITGNKIITDVDDFLPVKESSMKVQVMAIPPPETYGILLMSASGSYIKDNEIIDHINASYGVGTYGIGLPMDSNNNFLIGNKILESDSGIYLDWRSSNNEISGNKIATARIFGIALVNDNNNNSLTNNYVAYAYKGIVVYASGGNKLFNNTVINNKNGIWLEYGGGHLLVGNNVVNNKEYGIDIRQTGNNIIYHNNFINNTPQVSFFELYSNTWDCAYPSGGNYWSDYNGTDLFSGSYQNETGSDGIGDKPYAIDGIDSNHDNYPLMGTFSDFNATSEYYVQTISNSTISNFRFNGTAIYFNVTGENGTSGFCRIRIPTALMNGTYRVFVNGTEILPPPLPLPGSNSTYSYLYFNYTLSTKEVVIVPEFPSLIILPLFMIITLLAAVVYQRKFALNKKLSTQNL